MTSLEQRLSDLGDVLEERYRPITIEELSEPGATSAGDRTVQAIELLDEVPASASGTRRAGFLVAVAASILVVAGIVFLTDRNGDDVVAGPASSPEVASPTPLEGVTDPGRLEWSRLAYDEALFGGRDDLRMSSVTVGGPGLVAVGRAGSEDDGDAAVWTSTDGVTWSRVPHDKTIFGGDGQQAMNSVTAGGPGLVAVGHDGVAQSPPGEGDGVAAVWTSVDGLTWSRVPDDASIFGGAVDQGMFEVVVGGPGLVAVGGAGHGWNNGGDASVWTSVDGLTWSRVADDEEVFGGAGTQWMNSVTSGGPGLIAVGSSGQEFNSAAVVWASRDGIIWSRVPHDEVVFGGPGFHEMTSVTAGTAGLVAVGRGQPGDDIPAGPAGHAVVWTSVNGITWSRVPHDEAVFGGTGDQLMADVTSAGTGLVAVGANGGGYGTPATAAVWTSTDGTIWSRNRLDETVFGGSTMNGVIAGGPGLVAVGGDSLGDDDAADTAVTWVARVS